MGEAVNVLAVNRCELLAITDTALIGSIETWLDDEGDETDDPSAAVVAIVRWPDGTWSPVDLRDFDGDMH